MSGLGGLNPSPDGMVVGLVQFQLPTVETRADLDRTAQAVCDAVQATKRATPALDLVVFPEYCLHGLSMSMAPELMCDIEGPQVEALRATCQQAGVWGCFSIMERNPAGNPFNTGLVIDDAGEIQIHYRKLHPWVPVEPWAPGNLGIPVCDGPAGSRLGLIICHDGMLPEMAREAAYRGANVMIRTAGYTAPIRHAWRITNQANAFCNLMYTVSVCLAGEDGTYRSMGEGMICDFAGEVLVPGSDQPDELITGEVVPRRADEAREGWGVENNPYQLGHRAYVAVDGGERDCPYTFMHDLVAGEYRLPWEDRVEVTDGSDYGFPARAAQMGQAVG
jgi:formamidase